MNKEVRWVFQNNLIAENDLNQIQNSLKNLGIEYEEVIVTPFSDELPEFTLDEKENIYYGSTTFMNNVYNKVKPLNSFRPIGLFYNHKTFSMENYISKWGDYMLNSEARFTTVEEFLNEDNDPEENFFLRPDGDGKEFDGQVTQFKDAKSWFERVMQYDNALKADSKILVGPAYNIHREWRNYIVGGKVVTSSLYRENFKLKKSGKEEDIPKEMLTFVENRIKEYSPHECFAIDIASTHDGTYYIIECGCLNSVGFYDCNIGKLIKSVSEWICKWVTLRGERVEGYWFNKYNEDEHYPTPIPNILSNSQAEEIYKLIIEKEIRARIIKYMGFSHSRITGEILGSYEYHTKEWFWPSDFASHYVLKHKVKPTDDFLNYIGYDKM